MNIKMIIMSSILLMISLYGSGPEERRNTLPRYPKRAARRMLTNWCYDTYTTTYNLCVQDCDACCELSILLINCAILCPSEVASYVLRKVQEGTRNVHQSIMQNHQTR